jgi:hypothetical protein
MHRMCFSSHIYEIQDTRLVFIEKTSKYELKDPVVRKLRNVYNNKQYEFGGSRKENEQGKWIFNIDYTVVRVRDLERPNDAVQILHTQYEHEELKAAPVSLFAFTE